MPKIISKANVILELHAGWLWGNGQKKEAMECLKQANNDKRCNVSRANLIRDKKGKFIRYEDNNIGSTGNRKNNNSVKLG